MGGRQEMLKKEYEERREKFVPDPRPGGDPPPPRPLPRLSWLLLGALVGAAVTWWLMR